jgi:hypothetical protein
MIRYAMLSALLLGAAFAGQAHAQAVVEDPGYCAQYYPNSNCTNYGPGNPLYPGSFVPSGPGGAYYAPYAYGPAPYAAAPDGVIVRHRHRYHVYR